MGGGDDDSWTSTRARSARRLYLRGDNNIEQQTIHYERTGCCDICWTLLLEEESDDEDDQSTIGGGSILASILSPKQQRQKQYSNYSGRSHRKRSGRHHARHYESNAEEKDDVWDCTGPSIRDGEDRIIFNSEEERVAHMKLLDDREKMHASPRPSYHSSDDPPGIKDDSTCRAVMPTKDPQGKKKKKTHKNRRKGLSGKKGGKKDNHNSNEVSSKKKGLKVSSKPPRPPRDSSMKPGKFVKLVIRKKDQQTDGMFEKKLGEPDIVPAPALSIRDVIGVSNATHGNSGDPQISIKQALLLETEDNNTTKKPTIDYGIETVRSHPSSESTDHSSKSEQVKSDEAKVDSQELQSSENTLNVLPNEFQNPLAQLNTASQNDEESTAPSIPSRSIHSDNSSRNTGLVQSDHGNDNMSQSNESSLTEAIKNAFAVEGEIDSHNIVGGEVATLESREIDEQVVSQVKSDLSERSASSSREKVDDDTPSAIKIALQPNWRGMGKIRNKIDHFPTTSVFASKVHQKQSIGIPPSQRGTEHVFNSRDSGDEDSIFSMGRTSSRRINSKPKPSSYSFGTFGKRIRTRSLSRGSGNSVS